MSARPWVWMAVIALVAGGCGDDDDRRFAAADRPNAVAYAQADATGSTTAADADATSATNPLPDDTTDAPPDTTTAPDTAAPTDTAQDSATTPTDTASPGDTSPGTPSLTGPSLVALPYVDAGAGATQADVTVTNHGAAGALSVTVSGHPGLSITGAASSVGAGQTVTISVAFAGAATPTVAHGTLRVQAGGSVVEAPVYAVAGDPAIPELSWTPLTTQAGTVMGHWVALPFPTAPFPHSSASWSDPTVGLFVPESLRDRGVTDFVVHFHGFNATVAETVTTHRYREQHYLSGVNSVLVVPQGPDDAASGNFGKLMHPGGLETLLEDVVSVLFRDGWIDHPVRGDMILTAHSGGYQAVAENLDAVTDGGLVTNAHLIDGLYARSADYIGFAQAGGFFRSSYTRNGGTLTNNQAAISSLGALAVTTPTHAHLRDASAVIWLADTGHNDATRHENAYAETLRWGARRSRRGPRVALRATWASGGTGFARWLAPDDDDLTGFDVEVSEAGVTWSVAASAGPDAREISFPLSGPARVRLVPRCDGVPDALALRSDGFYAADRDVVVVDGFDRRVGSSFGEVRHDFAAVIAHAAGGAAALSNEALTEDGEVLIGWDVAIWLLGDESTGDHTFTTAEQAVVDGFVDAGGGVVVSGSEVGWDLDARNNGRAFLADLGASYASDDSGSYSVAGAGALAGLGSFTYAGPSAPYDEDFPDVLAPESGAEVVLRYGNGKVAAVGIAGRSVVVGFPLELIDDPTRRAAVVQALVDFVR